MLTVFCYDFWMAIGLFYGVNYRGGYVKYTPQDGKLLSQTQDFKSVGVKGDVPVTAKPSAKTSLLGGDVTAALNKIKMQASGNFEGSAGLDKKKTVESVAFNYTSSKITGQSDALKEALAKYGDAEKSDSIQIEIDDNGTKKKLTIKANSFIAPDGREFKYKGGDDLAKALRGAGIDIGGTISIDKTTVQDHLYTDENGVTQTQKGFTLLSYKIQTGNDVKSGTLAINDDFSDNEVTLQDAGDVTVDEKYAMANTTEKVQEQTSSFMFVGSYDTGVDVASIIAQQRKNAAYLAAVNSVTNNAGTSQVV
jgi:hypothetical protein